MKKLISITTLIASFALVVCLSGCAGNDNSDSNDSSTSATTEQSSDDIEQNYNKDELAEDAAPAEAEDENTEGSNETDETNTSDNVEDTVDILENNATDIVAEVEDTDYVASFDQPETLGGISYDIPEDWQKIESENYTNYYTSDFVVNGIVIDSDPNVEGEPLTAEEYNELYISQNTDVDSGYTVDTEMIQTREIDGCTCTIYKYVGQSTTMPQENDQGCFAFIDTPGDNYIIQFLGSSAVPVVNSLLDTLQVL